MTNHELINELEKQQSLVGKLAFADVELGTDVSEIMEKVKDPLFVGVLMYKLLSERERTNKILAELNEKYDKIMFEIKAPGSKVDSLVDGASENSFQILPEQDQLILRFIEEKGSATAHEVQSIMNYKGMNAASQRLNKLFKEGYLKKVQSGKRVVYLAKT